MSFASPELLFALIAVPLAAIGYRLLERRRARRAVAWTSSAMIPNAARRPPSRLRYIPAACFLLGLTFLLLGFARPQRTLASVNTSHGGGTTIVLLLDLSGSMAAQDTAPTRIAAAHAIAVRFLQKLPSRYRVALVTFGNEVQVPVPPTFNHRLVINRLPSTVIPRSGTSLGDAIAQATAVVVQGYGPSTPGQPYHPGAVLLISDGAQTAGGTTPDHAALFARADGIPIDTVAIGTAHGQVVQKLKIGNYTISSRISVPVDYSTLAGVAQTTRGTFYKGTALFDPASVSKLVKVYTSIGSTSVPGHRQHDLTAAAGEVALLFVLAGIVLSGLWFGRIA
jgi:Ca-activated chloride channel homolog